MALTRKTAKRNSWQQRAERLAIHPALTDERMHPHGRAESLSRTHASIEPEEKPGAAREELVHRENENRSLQTSLDLLVSENDRLSRNLTERDAAAAAASKRIAELEVELSSVRQELVVRRKENRSLAASLVAAEAELGQLAAAVIATNEKRQTEIDTLNARLDAMTSRATAAETSLADARQSWLVGIEENSIATRKVADATEARTLAQQKFELLQNSLEAKEREVQDLEASRAKLIEGANILLHTFKARDIALALAEERIIMLALQVAQLEAEVRLAIRNKAREIKFQLPCEFTERAVTVIAGGGCS